MLLVANGESETLAVLLPVGPDLILYIEDAGIFVINGRKFPGILRLISYNRESKRETTFNYPNAINWLYKSQIDATLPLLMITKRFFPIDRS